MLSTCQEAFRVAKALFQALGDLDVEWNGWKPPTKKQHGHERFETENHVVSIFLLGN